jgi:hypothetical protein
MSEIVYTGYTVKIIRQNGRVRKVAQQGFEAYLENEWQAIEKLRSLGVPSSMVLSVDATLETVASQNGITVPDFQQTGMKTLVDYLCVQEGVPLPETRDKDSDKQLFTQLSTALSQHVATLTDEKVASRVSIVLQVLGISDSYIAHMSHNDISPSNIAVQETSDTTRASLFDLNNAVVYDHNTVRPFVPLSKHRPGYPILAGVPIAKTWSHPNVTKQESLESLLSSPEPEKVFARNEIYQAANVLYWSLTGKRLQESSATVASQVSAKYKSLAEKIDALIGEVRKPIGDINLETIHTMRTNLSAALDSYKSSIPKPAAVPAVSAGFALPESREAPTMIEPYTPTGSSQVGAIVTAVKGSVDAYVAQNPQLQQQIEERNAELAILGAEKAEIDTALRWQRLQTSLWKGAAIISAVAGLSLAVAAGGISYFAGKYSVPSCPSKVEVCADSLSDAREYKTILDAHCPSTTDYAVCLDALATPQTLEKCPVSLSQYNTVMLKRNEFENKFEVADAQRQDCETKLKGLHKNYQRLSSAQAQNGCPDEYTDAYEHIGIYQSAAETWKKKDEQCEKDKKTVEAERDKFKQLAHTAHAPEREVYGMAAAFAYYMPEVAGKPFAHPESSHSFCGLMSHYVAPTAIAGEAENIRFMNGRRIDLIEAYRSGCDGAATTTTTP